MLLQHLLQLVINELNLGSDNDLASGLAGADNTGSTGSLNGLLVDSSAVLDLEAQTGSAVVNVGNVVLAADSSQNAGSDGGEVVVGEGDVSLGSLSVLILTTGGLQVELGERLRVKKSRISKIENDENLDIDVLLNALKHLDVEAQVVVTGRNKSEMAEVYSFISSCVEAFAKSKGLTRKSAFNYLNLFKGINLLVTCYDVEITLPLDEILNDLTLVCQRNGGDVR